MRSLILLLILIPLCSVAQPCGLVVKVYDGDTFTLLFSDSTIRRIRLHGIDCPALNQPFGRPAQQRAYKILINKRICIDSTDTDFYGRTIAIVPMGNTTLNELLLSEGLAWHYKKYDKNPVWAELETTARHNRKGLWRDEQPVEPWVWRKNKKK